MVPSRADRLTGGEGPCAASGHPRGSGKGGTWRREGSCEEGAPEPGGGTGGGCRPEAAICTCPEAPATLRVRVFEGDPPAKDSASCPGHCLQDCLT